MHSVDKLPRHAAARPGRNAKDSVRKKSPDPIIKDRIIRRTHQFGPVAGAMMPAKVWIVGAIVVFLLSFAVTSWLPDLTTSARHDVSKPTPGTSTLTSAVTTPSLQQPDNGRSVTPNPLIPIVIRRSTPPNAELCPPTLKFRHPWSQSQSQSTQLPPLSSSTFVKSKGQSVCNND